MAVDAATRDLVTICARSYFCPGEYANAGVGSKVWDVLSESFATLHAVHSAYRVNILLNGRVVIRAPAHLRVA